MPLAKMSTVYQNSFKSNFLPQNMHKDSIVVNQSAIKTTYNPKREDE
jgi:hypothetical protein